MKTIHVEHLKHVDPTKYVEGTLFISPKQLAILHAGKLDPLVKQSELRDYVKKKDVLALIQQHTSEVKK